MKTFVIILCFLGMLQAEVSFEANNLPGNVMLSGRERPVYLPRNVYVKEHKATADGKAHLLLLYRYVYERAASSDYYSLLLCRQMVKDEAMEWEVEFLMDEANMMERWEGRFRVIELGPFASPKDAVLKTGTPLPERTDGTGEISWERWDITSQSRSEVIRASKPFEPFGESK